MRSHGVEQIPTNMVARAIAAHPGNVVRSRTSSAENGSSAKRASHARTSKTRAAPAATRSRPSLMREFTVRESFSTTKAARSAQLDGALDSAREISAVDASDAAESRGALVLEVVDAHYVNRLRRRSSTADAGAAETLVLADAPDTVSSCVRVFLRCPRSRAAGEWDPRCALSGTNAVTTAPCDSVSSTATWHSFCEIERGGATPSDAELVFEVIEVRGDVDMDDVGEGDGAIDEGSDGVVLGSGAVPLASALSGEVRSVAIVSLVADDGAAHCELYFIIVRATSASPNCRSSRRGSIRGIPLRASPALPDAPWRGSGNEGASESDLAGIADNEGASDVRTVFLVRHGQSLWNLAKANKSVAGMVSTVDHPLSSTGVDECRSFNRAWRRVRNALRKTLRERERANSDAKWSRAPWLDSDGEEDHAAGDADTSATKSTPSGVDTGGERDQEEAALVDALTVEFLRPTAIYSSPLTRAVQTAILVLQDHPAFASARWRAAVAAASGPGANAEEPEHFEGFICPICMARLETQEEMVEHYEKRHGRDEDESSGADDTEGRSRVRLLRTAREIKKSLGALDCVGKASGDAIVERACHCFSELIGADDAIRVCEAVPIDPYNAVHKWWTTSVDSKRAIDARMDEFLRTLQYGQEPGTSSIVVGHSSFFLKLYRRHTPRGGAMDTLNPELSEKLRNQKLANAACVMVRMRFSQGAPEIVDARLMFDSKLVAPKVLPAPPVSKTQSRARLVSSADGPPPPRPSAAPPPMPARASRQRRASIAEIISRIRAPSAASPGGDGAAGEGRSPNRSSSAAQLRPRARGSRGGEGTAPLARLQAIERECAGLRKANAALTAQLESVKASAAASVQRHAELLTLLDTAQADGLLDGDVAPSASASAPRVSDSGAAEGVSATVALPAVFSRVEPDGANEKSGAPLATAGAADASAMAARSAVGGVGGAEAVGGGDDARTASAAPRASAAGRTPPPVARPASANAAQNDAADGRMDGSGDRSDDSSDGSDCDGGKSAAAEDDVVAPLNAADLKSGKAGLVLAGDGPVVPDRPRLRSAPPTLPDVQRVVRKLTKLRPARGIERTLTVTRDGLATSDPKGRRDTKWFAFIDVSGVHQHADGLSFDVVVRTGIDGLSAPRPPKAKQNRFRAETHEDLLALVNAICARAGIVASGAGGNEEE